ncbi:hypothetical protein [Alienimonas californiensis]|nr:hypothetical protein [Alienimonas californiensis]
MSIRPLFPAALCVSALLGLSALDRSAVSQDGAAPEGSFEPTTAGAREGIDVYPRRLPPGLGVLRLSSEQKERIYAVQAKYHVQIEKLRAEIAALEAKQEAEVTAALTPAQKDFLKAYEAMKQAEQAAAEKDAAETPADAAE